MWKVFSNGDQTSPTSTLRSHLQRDNIEVLERKRHLRGDRLCGSGDAEYYLQTFTYVVPARLMAAQKNTFDVWKK